MNEDERTNKFIDRMCVELRMNSVQAIRINKPNFTDAHAQELAFAMAGNKSLLKLDLLGSNCLTPKGVILLARAVEKSNNLTRFDLEDVDVNDEAIMAVARSLEHCTSLNTLGISRNRGVITQQGWIYLAESLIRNSTLRVLDLSDNGMTDDATASLATIILQQFKDGNNSKLQCLVLSMNHMKDKGAIAVAHSLVQNTTLRMLSLADNEVTTKGLRELEKMLEQNCYLQRLYMYANRFRYDCPERRNISYWLELNVAGRALFRDNLKGCGVGVLPYVLERISSHPCLVYGLLTELPHLWASVQSETG